MFYLLDPKVWIAIALAVFVATVGTVSYRAGGKSVQARWNAQKAADMQTRLKQEQTWRAREQELVAAKNASEVKYVQLKKRLENDSAGARSELDRLRAALAARAGGPAQNSAASAGADGGAGLERQLLGSCAQALVGLAATADRLEAQVVGLQGYVSNVCLAR